MRLRIVAGRAACTLACQAVACRAFLAPAGSLASTPAALAAAHRPLSHPRHVTHALASSRPHGIGRCHIAERCYAAVGGASSRRARALRMVNGGWQPGGGGGSTSLSPGTRAAFTALSVIGALWVGKVVSQAALFLLLPFFAAASLLIFTVAAQAAMLVFFVPVVATLALAPLLMVLPTGGLLLSLPTIMWLAYRGSSYLLGQWDSSSSSSSAQAAHSSVQDAVIVNDKAATSPKAAEPDAAEILARAAAEDLLDFDARLGTTGKATDGSYLSPDALAAGLAAEGLAAYAPVLRRAGVDSAVAATVTEDDLRTELGVTALGDRRRLLVYLQRVARR